MDLCEVEIEFYMAWNVEVFGMETLHSFGIIVIVGCVAVQQHTT